MSAISLTAEWAAWVAALAAPLHRRLARRMPTVVLGILMAQGRRTASSGWRAAGVGRRFRSYYYFLDGVGRKADEPAAVALRIVNQRVEPAGRLTFAIDDTPTRRHGPKVQGAGIHHDPAPGPAGSRSLYGHSWVVLSRVVHHDRFGTIGLPILGRLHVRKKDVPELPSGAGIEFRTKRVSAAEQLAWAGQRLPGSSEPPWVVVGGGHAKREFLKPAVRSGFVVVARLRRDAALFDLPPVLRPGQRRGPGRPPTYGKNRLSLAKRAGQTRGWRDIEARTTAGQVVTKQVKTFPATWRPAGGVVPVVVLKEDDGSWRAFLCTEAGADVAEVVPAVLDRWSIEQDLHDLKEVEHIEEVQLRRVWSNVGAFDLRLWVPTLTEAWAWDRAAVDLSDRGDRPWDDGDRRPSHADRRKALQRAMLDEEYRRTCGPDRLPEKFHRLFQHVVRLVA